MIRRRLIFFGQVQGVGFRWTARMLAAHHSCTGWVHNERDCSVSMEIQGEQQSIDRIIASLNEDRYIRIDKIESTDLPVEAGETEFRRI